MKPESIVAELLETDALTETAQLDGIYTVHEDDLEYLVKTIMNIQGQLEVEQMYKPSEVAKMLSVTRQTVQTWLKGGMLNGVKIGMGKYWRISESELKRFINKRYGDEG